MFILARLSHLVGRRAAGTLIALVALTGCPAAEPNLSETSLYADIQNKTLAAGFEPYTPQFELWTDGIQKRRYIRLPEGERINTEDMDAWVFPTGTEIFKEFLSGAGKRLETRRQRKEADGTWSMATYVWDADESDARLTSLGAGDINGTEHNSPTFWECTWCHDAAAKPLGFSAIQLSHDDEGLNLTKLIERSLLTHAPDTPPTLPGDALDRQVLGALHVNCGGCHGDRGGLRDLDLRLDLRTDALETVEGTPAYRTAVGVSRGAPMDDRSTYIVPGNPEDSLILHRMLQRGDAVQMPPIATERTDDDTVQAVEAWIGRLDIAQPIEE